MNNTYCKIICAIIIAVLSIIIMASCVQIGLILSNGKNLLYSIACESTTTVATTTVETTTINSTLPEECPTTTCQWSSFYTADTHTYDKILTEKLSNEKSILLYVHAKNDAHIGLSENMTIDGERYEIVIGGIENTVTVIRKCSDLHGCDTETEIIEPSLGILSATEYRTFWIDTKNGLVRVGKGPIIGDNIVVTYTYSGDDILNPNYVGFRTGWGSGGANWNVCLRGNC